MTDIEQKKAELAKRLQEVDKQQENIQDVIKKEDKHAVRKFVAITLSAAFCGGIIGGIIGVLSGKYPILTGSDFVLQFRKIEFVASDIMRYVLYAVTILIIIAAVILVHYVKVSYKKWDKEDEQYVENLEKKISACLILTTISMIIVMLSYGASSYIMISDEKEFDPFCVVAFIVGIIAILLFQKEIVNTLKMIHHDKRGSIYDKKFQEKWIDSCDEAEKMIIYKTGYYTFQKMNTFISLTCYGVMLIGFFVEIGMVPLFICILIYLANNITYWIEGNKLEKKEKRKDI